MTLIREWNFRKRYSIINYAKGWAYPGKVKCHYISLDCVWLDHVKSCRVIPIIVVKTCSRFTMPRPCCDAVFACVKSSPHCRRMFYYTISAYSYQSSTCTSQSQHMIPCHKASTVEVLRYPTVVPGGSL